MPGLLIGTRRGVPLFSGKQQSSLAACVSKLPCSVNYRIIGCRRLQTLFIQSISSHKFPLPFPVSLLCVRWSCDPADPRHVFSLWALISALRPAGNQYKLNSNHSQAALFHTAVKPALSSPGGARGIAVWSRGLFATAPLSQPSAFCCSHPTTTRFTGSS